MSAAVWLCGSSCPPRQMTAGAPTPGAPPTKPQGGPRPDSPRISTFCHRKEKLTFRCLRGRCPDPARHAQVPVWPRSWPRRTRRRPGASKSVSRPAYSPSHSPSARFVGAPFFPLDSRAAVQPSSISWPSPTEQHPQPPGHSASPIALGMGMVGNLAVHAGGTGASGAGGAGCGPAGLSPGPPSPLPPHYVPAQAHAFLFCPFRGFH